jgi:preprotein translocase subunit SecB
MMSGEEEKDKTGTGGADGGARAAEQTAGMMKAPALRVDNILLKNVSLEMPDGVVAPTFSSNSPNVNLQIRNSARPLKGEDLFEATLEVTARVRDGERTMLLIEVAQAGIFGIKAENAAQKQAMLNVHAPEILYPYASQCVCDLMLRAGAPRVFLPPFNFKALFEKKREYLRKQENAPRA